MSDDIFINKPIRNPKLLKLLKEVKKEGSSEVMLEVLKEASVATLVVPVTEGDNGVSFNAVTDSKKRRFIVVFSDTDSFDINKSYDSQKAVTASFEDLMDVVMTPSFYLDGMIINPGSEDVLFGKDLISMITEQMDSNSDDVEIKVGAPDHYPDKFYSMMKEFMIDETSVNKIYVRLFHKVKEDETSWMFILDIDSDDLEKRKYICETFNRFIAPYTDGLSSITIDINEEYAREAVADVKPFVIR